MYRETAQRRSGLLHGFAAFADAGRTVVINTKPCGRQTVENRISET